MLKKWFNKERLSAILKGIVSFLKKAAGGSPRVRLIKLATLILVLTLSIFLVVKGLNRPIDEEEQDTEDTTPTIVDTTKPVIQGVKDITVDQFTELPDLLDGVSASDDIDEVVELVVDSSSVDMNTAGEYTIIYRAKDKAGNEEEKTATVIVLDKESPVIHGAEELTVDQFSALPDLLFDVYAEDNIDEAVEVIIQSHTIDVNVAGTYELTYYAVDNQGNEATLTVKVIVVDREAPELSIPYEDEIILQIGGELPDFELGVTATDNVDEELVVTVNHNVDVNVSGEYSVLYHVSDKNGNEVTKSIKVIVKEFVETFEFIDEENDIQDTYDIYTYKNSVIVIQKDKEGRIIAQLIYDFDALFEPQIVTRLNIINGTPLFEIANEEGIIRIKVLYDDSGEVRELNPTVHYENDTFVFEGESQTFSLQLTASHIIVTYEDDRVETYRIGDEPSYIYTIFSETHAIYIDYMNHEEGHSTLTVIEVSDETVTSLKRILLNTLEQE